MLGKNFSKGYNCLNKLKSGEACIHLTTPLKQENDQNLVHRKHLEELNLVGTKKFRTPPRALYKRTSMQSVIQEILLKEKWIKYIRRWSIQNANIY